MFLMIFLKFYAISEQFMYIFRETSSYVSHCARFSRNLTKSSPYQHNLRDFRETSPNPRQILTKSSPNPHQISTICEIFAKPSHISTICEIYAKPRKPSMKSYSSSKSILKFKSLKLSQKI